MLAIAAGMLLTVVGFLPEKAGGPDVESVSPSVHFENQTAAAMHNA
jgi:hypothetical protein